MGKLRLSDCLSFSLAKAPGAFGLFIACILLLSPVPAAASGLSPLLMPVDDLNINEHYQAGSQTTSGVTDFEIVADYSCNNGVASGSIYRSDRCAITPGFAGVFSSVICRIESILGQTIGELYCAISHRAEKPFLALLILYVTVYGAMVIMGMNQARLPEAIMHVFKIGLVSIFILNAPLALGVGYKFFISGAQTAAGLAFEAFEDRSAQEAFASDLQQVDPLRGDRLRESGLMEGTDGGNALNQNQGASQWVDNADRMFFKFIIYILRAMGGIIVVMILLFFAAPWLFFLLLTFFVKLFQAIFQIVVGYLLALVGLTFLFSLAPIIVPLWLFRFSQSICQTWLKYLASYAIQIGICMMFIALFTKVDFVGQMEQLGTLGRQKDLHVGAGWLHWRFMQWTLCRVERSEGTTGDIVYYRFDPLNNATVEGQAWNGFPRCMPTYTYNGVMNDGVLPPTISPEEVAELKELQSEDSDDADDAKDALITAIDKANDDNIYDFWEVLNDPELMGFFATRLIAIIALTIIMTIYMARVPSVAERIAQTPGSGQLGGGQIDPAAPSIQASSGQDRNNDPLLLQQYLRSTKNRMRESREDFQATRGRFFVGRNALGFAGSALMTPLALMGVGARRNGGYRSNLGGHFKGMTRRGYNAGFGTLYHGFAGANSLRQTVQRSLTTPGRHVRLAYNENARRQMMDMSERRDLIQEGERLTRTREDSQYSQLGENMRARRNRFRAQAVQNRSTQRAARNSGAGGGRPATTQRHNTVGGSNRGSRNP